MTDWQIEPLEDCLDVLIDYRGKSPKKSPTGIPVLSAKVVKTAGLLRPIEQTISASYYKEWMTRGLPMTGDVVMTTEAPLGEIIQLNEETSKFALGQRIVCLRGRQGKIDNTFLRYALTSPAQQSILAGHATGTTVLGISQKALRKIPLSYPNLDEQIEIGGLLANLDNKIELNRQMNETLEATARALFRDWFVDFGPTRRKAAGEIDPVKIMGGAIPFPEKSAPIAALFPDALGEGGLPVGWEERPFESFLDIVGGGTPKTKVAEYWGGDIPWFSVVDAPPNGGVFIHSTEKYISKEGLSNSSARMVPEGTTIISARGTVGKIGMAPKDMTFNQSCYALRPVAPVGERFVFLATERLVERLQAMAHGSVFSTITRSTFSSLNFAWPTQGCFDAFETFSAPLFAKIKANGEENQTLAQMRDLLLPKLMSGEIRLEETVANT